MSKELFVTSTPHETKLAIVEDDQLVEVYFERENEYTLAGSIYKGRTTRVLPGMQSAFVDIGLERDAFLYVSDFVEGLEEDQDEIEPAASQGQQQSTSSGQGQRGGRQDRGRDRHGRGDRLRRDNRGPRPPAEVSPEEGVSAAEPVELEADYTGEEPAVSEQAEAAEGIPAQEQTTDGPRRWRGRRGRRRRGGRGHSQPSGESTQPQAETSAEAPEEEQHLSGDVLDETEFSGDFTETPETEEPTTGPETGFAAPEEAPEETRESFPAAREPRRDRDFGSGRERATREPGESRPNKPVILPGESLRKFNREAPEPPKAATPQSTVVNTFRPSTLVEPAGLAGKGILAGETLRKYQGRPVDPLAVTPEPSESIAEPVKHEIAAQHEPIAQQEQPVQTAPVDEVAAEPESFSAASSMNAALEEEREFDRSHRQEETPEAPSQSFDPGVGEVEEELVEEEEQHLPNPDSLALHEDYDTFEHEELEEETIDDRESEVLAAGEPLAAAFAESRRENEESFIEELDADEVDEIDEAAEDDEAEEAFAGEEEEEPLDPEDPDYEGRAEVRAPAGTAAFQQRAEPRQGQEGFDRKRGGRRGRPMRGRPGMRRGGPRRAPRVLPQINEVLKEGQEILVQIAKEPMAKKGARITSHIALPGRFLVYMPTVGHTGVSRKIASEEERQRLKRILLSEKGQNHGGFIVRTAASGASEDDLRADIRFLINLWNEIKQRSEASKAPALIYHDLNLVERILRDQVTSTFSQIWVDSEQEYERILRFATRFQPSLVKRVKLYTKDIPLFEQFNVQEEINKALKSKVWLKSGGYIVINQTEALVAIDINTGKFVGKTARLEDTIVKTNIDAIKEIVRQIRLRDLGGIIVIDFIDMEERKNRQKVMQELELALKADRSPSKVLQFNDFGLVAITRKRVKQSLERTLGTQCTYCQGTGMIKSVATICNEIYVELRKMLRHLERNDITLRVNPEVGKALKANTGRWLLEMEEMVKRPIIVKSDPLLHQEQFDIN